jgi:RNA polymerase sigma-70 factor (ECF subfamily)
MEESDVSLVGRFRKSGDRAAFETLVMRHLPALRRFLAVLVPGDADGAADAEQEVLIRLHRSLGRWRGEGAFTTWLYTLARRVCIDEIRRRVRERNRIDRFARRSRPEEEVIEREENPENAWVTVEEGQALRRALATLPEPDRTLVYLKDAEGVSVEELAQIHGLNEGTVKSKLSRARAKLRALLQEERYA